MNNLSNMRTACFLSACFLLMGGLSSPGQSKGDAVPDRVPRPVVRGELAVPPPKAPAAKEHAPRRPVQPDRVRPERPTPSRPGPGDIHVPSRPEMPAPVRKPSADATPERRTRPVERPGGTDTPGLERAGPPLDVIDRQRVGDIFREERMPDGFGHDLPGHDRLGITPIERHGIPMPREQDMPVGEIPGQDMGPAGAAGQPPSGFPFDGRRGRGIVASGGADGGIVRRERGLDSTTYHLDDGSVVVVHHPPEGSGGRDTYVRHPAPGSGEPVTIHYYDDDGELVTEVLESTREPAAEQEETAGQDQQEEGEEEMPLAPIIQPGEQEEEETGENGETDPDEPDKDDPNEEDSSDDTGESRPGDPDGLWGDEMRGDRFGITDEPDSSTPADDGRVGGDGEEEHESVHAPRPELDVEAEAAEQAEQVGDRRKRGPQDISIQFTDPLRDPPRDVDQSAP